MFATDRDLLTIEPSLFRDAAPAGQRLLKGTADIAGTTLTLTAQDVDLAAANIGQGHVVLVDGTPYEILERLTSTTATISRPRASINDLAQPPSPASGKPVEIWTFAPQLARAHAEILRMVGIDPGEPAAPGIVTESCITNPISLRDVEAFAALYLIYTFAAGPAVGWEVNQIWERGQIYLQRFDHHRQLAAARIDTDNDGLPDATRRLNTLILTRC
jgi:hypothetical protein